MFGPPSTRRGESGEERPRADPAEWHRRPRGSSACAELPRWHRRSRGECVRAIEQIQRRPRLRFPPGEAPNSSGGCLAREGDPGVDAANERRHDGLRIRPVARPLRIQIAAVLHTARPSRGDLGEIQSPTPPRRGAAPARRHGRAGTTGPRPARTPGRRTKSRAVASVDVRNAPSVAHECAQSADTPASNRPARLGGRRRRRPRTSGCTRAAPPANKDNRQGSHGNVFLCSRGALVFDCPHGHQRRAPGRFQSRDGNDPKAAGSGCRTSWRGSRM